MFSFIPWRVSVHRDFIPWRVSVHHILKEFVPGACPCCILKLWRVRVYSLRRNLRVQVFLARVFLGHRQMTERLSATKLTLGTGRSAVSSNLSRRHLTAFMNMQKTTTVAI
jgi:hypothetical protein